MRARACRLGSHVSAVWPGDGARLRVYGHAGEVVWITQRLKDATPGALREVGLPTVPSSKVRRNRCSPMTSTPVTFCSWSISSMLGQGVDRYIQMCSVLASDLTRARSSLREPANFMLDAGRGR